MQLEINEKLLAEVNMKIETLSESPCRKCTTDKASCCGCPEWIEWKEKMDAVMKNEE
jgi:hypothetical protein